MSNTVAMFQATRGLLTAGCDELLDVLDVILLLLVLLHLHNLQHGKHGRKDGGKV
jgi:hypothetical protein